MYFTLFLKFLFWIKFFVGHSFSPEMALSPPKYFITCIQHCFVLQDKTQAAAI